MAYLTADPARWTNGEKPGAAARPGEFGFSAVGLEHGHIYSMTRGLREAGGTLRFVYDPDPGKVAAFLRANPEARAARCEAEALEDPGTRLVAGAAVPSERCALGLRAMDCGKDYFTDKGPFTDLGQLEEARRKTAETGLKYMVYYSERLHDEASVLAERIIAAGEIGRVVSVSGFGPHRVGPEESRPAWFWEKAKYGGILCDIGSHQIEQFLFFAGEEDARVASARVGNYAHPDRPEFEDFGDCALTGANGAAGYFRVDWFTPDGLRTWGDGRTLILGTEGYIEMRKCIDVAAERAGGGHLFLVSREGERHVSASGAVGCPFFGRLIRDCLDRTETAMTQEHTFRAAELCLLAQKQADEAPIGFRQSGPGTNTERAEV